MGLLISSHLAIMFSRAYNESRWSVGGYKDLNCDSSKILPILGLVGTSHSTPNWHERVNHEVRVDVDDPWHSITIYSLKKNTKRQRNDTTGSIHYRDTEHDINYFPCTRRFRVVDHRLQVPPVKRGSTGADGAIIFQASSISIMDQLTKYEQERRRLCTP